MDGPNWTHAICIHCWNEARPGRRPVRSKFIERCCFCTLPAIDAILIRADPDDCECNGKGGIHVRLDQTQGGSDAR